MLGFSEIRAGHDAWGGSHPTENPITKEPNATNLSKKRTAMHTRRSLQSSMFLVVPAALALGWAGRLAANDDQKFPATGQTTCYNRRVRAVRGGS